MACTCKGVRRDEDPAVRVYLTGACRARLLSLVADSGRHPEEIISLALDLFSVATRDSAAIRGWRRLKREETRSIKSVGSVVGKVVERMKCRMRK
jgi:hypothetical protein